MQVSRCLVRRGLDRGWTHTYTSSPAGAKLGAIIRRHQATPSPFKRSIYLPDLRSSHSERHRATAGTSFASRGSGVQIPSAPPVSAGQRPTQCLQLVSLGNNGEPIADLPAAGGRRRPDSRAIPGCLPLRAEGATAPAMNRRHQVEQRAIALGEFPAYPGNYIQQVRPGFPREAPATARTANWSLRLSRSRNEHPEGTAPASPLRPPDRPGWPHTSQRTGAQAKEDPARERAVARMQGRQLAHKAEDAGPRPARRAESGGR